MIARVGHLRLPVLLLAVGTVIWIGILSATHLSGRGMLGETLEFRLLDLRHRLSGPAIPAPEVAIVAIDDDALAAAEREGLGRRAMIARLVANSASSDAVAVVLDILLADSGDPDQDARLAAALSETRSAIAAAANYGASGDQPALILPQDSFGRVAEVGLVNLATDAGGTPRFVPLVFSFGDGAVPSLALMAALLGSDAQATFDDDVLIHGDRRVRLVAGNALPLRYLGPRGSIPTFGASALLMSPMPQALSGKRVVIGFTAAAMGDRFTTPFDDDMPGVEVIATAISQLTGGPTLRRDAVILRWDVFHASVLGVLAVAALVVWPLSRSVPLVLILVALSFGIGVLLFGAGIWSSSAFPLLAALPPAVLAGAMRYLRERDVAARSARSVVSLRRFQSPVLARRIERDPHYLEVPQELDLVVLFADLTGFTRLSQQLGPSGTQRLLQEFHRICADCVERRGGSVFNFMGDGIIAVFGIEPAETGMAPDQALEAAVDLVRRVSGQSPAALPDMTLRCRVGLHNGPVTLSRLGADRHQQVTVTGDTVNVASRLMEVAKEQSAALAVSGSLHAALAKAPDPQPARHVKVTIRGRDGEETVYVWTQASLGLAP